MSTYMVVVTLTAMVKFGTIYTLKTSTSCDPSCSARSASTADPFLICACGIRHSTTISPLVVQVAVEPQGPEVALELAAQERRRLPAARVARLLAAQEDQVLVRAGAGLEGWR